MGSFHLPSKPSKYQCDLDEYFMLISQKIIKFKSLNKNSKQRRKNNIFQITTTANLSKNADVYLIIDFQKEQNDLAYVKRLPVDFKLLAYANKPLELEYILIDEKTNQVRVSGKVFGEICQTAKSIPLDYNSAKQSMQKLSETPFVLNNFLCETDCVFVGKQQLNNLRKNAVEKILNNFENNKNTNINFDYLIAKLKILNNFEINSKNKEKFKNFKNEFVLLKPSDYTSFYYDNFADKNAYLFIPPFMRNNDIKLIKNILQKYPNLGIYANNLSALNLGENNIILGANMNIKNIFAINEILDDRIQAIVASPELSEENYNLLRKYANVPIIQSSFDDIDLMAFVHCPIKNIFDSTCQTCKYQEGIEYVMQNGQKLCLHRYKLKNCYFGLSKK